mgnify:CR=1 FL=1|jgi:mannose-6-phosphate isomerase-like protein (cupin superfamily)
MSAYTIKNITDVENAAAKHGRPGEARFVREALGCEQNAFSYQRVEPNGRSLAHRHSDHEELYFILSGSGRVKLDDDIRDVGRFDIVRVAPTVVRQFEAGPDGLELIAIGDKGFDQAEIVEDFWP